MKIIAIIPAYNEETTLAAVIERTRPLVSEVVVIDDGSADGTGRIAHEAGAVVIRHIINRGLGAALGTGFAAALLRDADMALTLDADGQHDPEEIPVFVEAIEAGADVVIGSRLLHPAGMPWHWQLANRVGNLVTFVLFGAMVTDSQSGFRAFSRRALSLIEVRTNRMEVSSELIAETRRNRLPLTEVPIRAIYTEYSMSKGQSFSVGLKTLFKLVLRRVAHWV